MSSPAYSASVVTVAPVLLPPSLLNKHLTITSAIANKDHSTAPIHFTYWPGSEPRAAQEGDTVFISGSVCAAVTNGVITFLSSATFVNVIIAGEDAGCVDPASDMTAIFSLTGVVTSHAAGEREFTLETGAWDSTVRLLFQKFFNIPSALSVQASANSALPSGVKHRALDSQVHVSQHCMMEEHVATCRWVTGTSPRSV